jgi:hypothetical protein
MAIQADSWGVRMAGTWEANETARYIAEMCLDLKRLALNASLNDLAEAIEGARRMAEEASKRGQC